jgi:hypothetical protein
LGWSLRGDLHEAKIARTALAACFVNEWTDSGFGWRSDGDEIRRNLLIKLKPRFFNFSFRFFWVMLPRFSQICAFSTVLLHSGEFRIFRVLLQCVQVTGSLVHVAYHPASICLERKIYKGVSRLKYIETHSLEAEFQAIISPCNGMLELQGHISPLW